MLGFRTIYLSREYLLKKNRTELLTSSEGCDASVNILSQVPCILVNFSEYDQDQSQATSA